MTSLAKSEKAAARTALAWWRELLTKAAEQEEEDLEDKEMRERLKSLDAAWVRYDNAHVVTLSQGRDMVEEEDWEVQMKVYCEARKRGVEALRKTGVVITVSDILFVVLPPLKVSCSL